MLLLLIYVAAVSVALSAAVLLALKVRRFAWFVVVSCAVTWIAVSGVAALGFRYPTKMAPAEIGLILAAIVAVMLLAFGWADRRYLTPYLRRKREAAASSR
jgi:uncharacterized membrane protein YphA (DoxX/SURF4 family)